MMRGAVIFEKTGNNRGRVTEEEKKGEGLGVILGIPTFKNVGSGQNSTATNEFRETWDYQEREGELL